MQHPASEVIGQAGKKRKEDKIMRVQEALTSLCFVSSYECL